MQQSQRSSTAAESPRRFKLWHEWTAYNKEADLRAQNWLNRAPTKEQDNNEKRVMSEKHTMTNNVGPWTK